MPVYPRAARFVFARATDQGQPEGAKGVVLHLLPTSQTTPFGQGMLQPVIAETVAVLTTLSG